MKIVKLIGFKFIGVLLIFIPYYYIKIIYDPKYSILSYILLAWVLYPLTYRGLGILLHEPLKRFSSIIFIYNKVLILPLIILNYFIYAYAPLATVVTFFLFYLSPSMFFLVLVNIYPTLQEYEQGGIYLLSLFSVVIFAYKSDILMRFVLDMNKTKLFKNHLYRAVNITFTRIYTYLIMIIIYILYNFLTFSNFEINLFPPEMLNVVKEVFVTFVAIDALYQFYSTHKENEQNDKG